MLLFLLVDELFPIFAFFAMRMGKSSYLKDENSLIFGRHAKSLPGAACLCAAFWQACL
jgi:hypothetical protein